jgi:hypothetical protein
LTEARAIKKVFQEKLETLFRMIDQKIYKAVQELKDDFCAFTEAERNKLFDSLNKIFDSHKLDAGKDNLSKLNNSNVMLNEINKLEPFVYEIDETQKNIEQEYETTKEILEQKIHSTYSSVFQESDLFSQWVAFDNNLQSKVE